METTLVNDVQAIEARASELRGKINPLATGEAHRQMWQRGKMYKQEIVPHASARYDLPPAAWTTFLEPAALKIGGIQAGAECQYRAFARALFGDGGNFHEQLRALAADFLWCNRETYEHDVSSTELGSRSGFQRIAEELMPVGSSPDLYQSWCEALKQGRIWGQDYTLEAMCKLLHVEVRLVVNMRLQRDGQPPRLKFRSFDFSEEHGAPKAVTYLGLNQTFTGEHYSTVEQGDPKPAAHAMVPSDEAMTDDAASLQTDLGEETITIADESYSIAELESGVSCGDNQHVYILEHVCDEYIIYKLDVKCNAREEIRRIPVRTKHGLAKKDMSVAQRNTSVRYNEPVRISEKDVESWVTRLTANDGGVQATGALAQAVLDAILRYIDHLELINEKGSTYMDGLGVRIHKLADAAKQIRQRFNFEAHSESQLCFKVIIVGVEGSGKSTTLNSCLRSLMQEDATLALVHSTKKVTQHFTALHAGEFGQVGCFDDELAKRINDEDLKLEQELGNKKGKFNTFVNGMNKKKDDILPTGKGVGSMTALPTFVELDPDTTVAQLKLTYRERSNVDFVLKTAEKIKEHENSLEEMPKDLQEVDVNYVAHEACAMLNIVTGGGDGVKQICDYTGAFKLPDHLYLMLGRVRTLKVEASSQKEMLQQINSWLMMHTIGPWSHWGIVSEVRCVLPAKDGVRMMILDMPGAGNKRSNPFRQGLVSKAISNSEASTLLVCLQSARIDNTNNESSRVLEQAGVYEELFGDQLQRKIGQVVAVTSLDWGMQDELQEASTSGVDKDEVHTTSASFIDQSKKWLAMVFKEAAENNRINKCRVQPVLDAFTKAYSIDVRGRVEQTTGITDYSMSILTDALRAASSEALKRRQELLFRELVLDVLLPFYEEHAKIGYLRCTLKNNTKFNVPSLRGDDGLLRLTLNAGDQALMGNTIDWDQDSTRRSSRRQQGELDPLSASSHALTAVHAGDAGASGFVHTAAQRRKGLLRKEVMQDILDKGTAGPLGVESRWDADEGFPELTFQLYRKTGSRELGYDLKAKDPQETLLTDLLMPEITHRSVLQLQEKLRSWKPYLIQQPINAMHRQLEKLFTQSMRNNMEGLHPESEDYRWLGALEHALCVNLQGWKQKEIDRNLLVFESSLCQLPQMHNDVIKNVLTKWQPIILKIKGNKARKSCLCSNAKKIASEVSEGTLEQVLSQVLVILNASLRKSFEVVVTQTHAYMQAAIKKGETRELESSGAFPVSQHYARFTAGLIAAVHMSNLAKEQLDEYVHLNAILELAQSPATMLNDGEGLEALFRSDAMDVTTTELAQVVEPLDGPANGQPKASKWQCGNCESKYEEGAGRYQLKQPCRFQPDACWCESIEARTKFCRRCVRYYNHHVKKDGKCIKRPAHLENLVKQKALAPSPHKRRKTSNASTSASNYVEEVSD
ncbi:hypothetical protein AB1Y20_014725 [Prymnesium parvum]|uniref:Ubiquitinyl hydrolase 1 n=1 Tax=Prymnesium parvum TaxID=97485 RepID=A0AB34IEZ9_PRYPA